MHSSVYKRHESLLQLLRMNLHLDPCLYLITLHNQQMIVAEIFLLLICHAWWMQWRLIMCFLVILILLQVTWLEVLVSS